MEHNLGQLALYNSGIINDFSGWLAYTDSDIELGEETPPGFIEDMISMAEKHRQIKCGLALDISDLPDSAYGNRARWWEQRYWVNRIEEEVYSAHVDTTFSVVIVGQPFTYEAIRMAGKYTAKHIPWYLDYDNLTEEEQYILDHSDSEFSTTKRFVDSLKIEV